MLLVPIFSVQELVRERDEDAFMGQITHAMKIIEQAIKNTPSETVYTFPASHFLIEYGYSV